MSGICTGIRNEMTQVGARHENIEIMVFAIMANICSLEWAGPVGSMW